MTTPLIAVYIVCKLIKQHLVFLLMPFWLIYELINQNWLLSWPWLILGHALGNEPFFIQWYGYTGVYSGTLWILLTSFLLFKVLQNGESKKRNLICAMITIILPLVISLLMDMCILTKNNHRVKVTTHIPCLPEDSNMEKTKSLYDYVIANKHGQIILCPELYFQPISLDRTSLNRNLLYFNELIKSDSNLIIFAGAEVLAANGKLYNVFLSCDQSGVMIKTKRKYVPVTEYTPTILEPIAGKSYYGFAEKDQQDDIVKKHHILPLLCYESVFSSYTCNNAIGNSLIFLSTSEEFMRGSVFGKRQYYNIVRIRAIETKRNVVKCSNKGISGVINEKGSTVRTIEREFETFDVFLIDSTSFYCKALSFIKTVRIKMKSLVRDSF